MPPLYFTPTALSSLTLFIFTGSFAGYLWYLARQTWRPTQKPLTTLTLAGTFSGVAAYALLKFLEDSLYPDLGFFIVPLQSVAAAIIPVCLIQFAYHFPVLYPERRREARLVFWLSLSLPLWEIYFAIHRYAQLAHGKVRYRPEMADYFIAAIFIWLFIILIRQMGCAGGQSVPLRQRFPQKRGWHKLVNLQGTPARAVRAFLWISLFPLGSMAVIILRNEDMLSTYMAALILSQGLLFGLLFFGLVYLNYIPETTSFMVKLVVITLAIILGMAGTIGHLISPAFIAMYQPLHFIADHQTLRFSLNSLGGYDIAALPFQFRTDLGDRLDFNDQWVVLPFVFPFYGQDWDSVYMLIDGAVSFGGELDWTDTRYRYGPTPGVFVLATDFINPVDGYVFGESEGLFVHSTPAALTLTWANLPEKWATENIYTLQLTLFPSGVFEITFDGLPAHLNFDIYSRRHTAWSLGAFPGSRVGVPQPIRFDTGLPTSSGPDGVVEDYHRDFRQALHEWLAPLVYLIIASTVVVMLGLPLAFHQNIVNPLTNLLKGVQEVNTGNLNVSIPVQFQDEFGFLTASFNTMTAELNTLVADLEGRVVERTAELAQSQHATEAARGLLDAVLSNLDTLIYVSDMDTCEVLFANQRIQQVFGSTEGQLCWQVFQDEQEGPCPWCTNHLLVTEDGTPAGPHQWEMQNTINGRWYSIVDNAVEWVDGRLVRLSMAMDITMMKAAENRLLTQQRALAAVEERQRLARDLHDSVTQTLHSLSITADTALYLHQQNNPAGLENALRMLDEAARLALKEMRLLLFELNLAPDAQTDLLEVLQTRLERVEQRAGVQVDFSLEGAAFIPKAYAAELYYIAIEALNNALKHAQANHISVDIQADPRQIELRVRDNGRGFIPEAQGDAGMGLANMAARAAKLGGELKIESAPGSGTCVRCRVEF